MDVNIPPLHIPLTTLEKEPVSETTKQSELVTETDNTLPIVSKLRVYTKRNKTQNGGKVSESTMHCHESTPEPNTQNTTGNEISYSTIDIELSIILRKGVRSCTMHSIQDYVSYGKLFSKYHTLMSKFDSSPS